MAEELIPLTAQQLRARRGKKWGAYDPDVLPAWIADMDFLTASPVRDALRRLAEEANFGYSTQPDDLGRAFAAHAAARYGWEVDERHVVVVDDLVQAVVASIMAFSRPGDGVALAVPAYPPLLAAIKATGRRRAEVPMVCGDDGWQLDLQCLRRQLQQPEVSMLLMCNPHNPTGSVMDPSTLERVASIAEETGVTVVADEIHCDLVHAPATFTPFATTHAALRTVSLHSATKSFNLGGLRCGIVHLGSPELTNAFHRAHPDRLLGRPNVFGALATVTAWEKGGPWLDSLLSALRTNRDLVAEWVERTPGVAWRAPEGTYFAWLDFTSLKIDEPAAAYLLRQARVALNPGQDFGPELPGSCGSAFARLNFAMSTPILLDILGRISQAVDAASSDPGRRRQQLR